jgi:hypothetical protein
MNPTYNSIMSFEEIRQTVRVDKDHQVVLSLPDMAEGTELRIIVQPVGKTMKRVPGSAKGMLKIEKGFDEPLDEFRDYR